MNKTKAICLASGQFTIQIDLAGAGGIRWGQDTIPFERTVKTLGVIFSWSDHVDGVCARVKKGLHQLRIHRDLFNKQLWKRLVTTLIFAYFDYCSLVHCDITKEQNLRLQRAFNSCVRFVHRPRCDAHVSPFRLQEGWLSMEHRHTLNMACLFRTILLTHTSVYLYDLVIFPQCIRTTRVSSQRVQIPLCRTEIYKRSFITMAAHLWNSLPEFITDAPSLPLS